MLERKQNKKGFTLIELLVVIAIISLLLAILMPSLRAAKKIAQGVVCIANMRGISMSALIYTDNNAGKFPGSFAGDDYGYVRVPRYADGTTISTAGYTNPNCPMGKATLDDRVRGITAGVLFTYTEDYKLYHCPGDRRFSGQFHNYLSYSMPDGIPDKRVRIITPDSKYIFLEESDPRPYFSGDWDLVWDKPNPNDQGWQDGLAIWHNNASTFAFADGHAESRKWSDAYTRIRAGWTYEELMAMPGSHYIKFPYGANAGTYGNVRNDLDWMIQSHPGKGAR